VSLKVKLSDVVKPITFEFLGGEEWLSPIRNSFVGMNSPLTGHLQIHPMGRGRFEIKGKVSFEPKVPCSKCNDPIPWKIEEDVFVAAQKISKSRYEEQESEIELSTEDLEIYEIKGDVLDLEMILNDVVHLALPSRCVLVEDVAGEEKCLVCGDIG